MLKALISFDPMNENGGELAFALKTGMSGLLTQISKPLVLPRQFRGETFGSITTSSDPISTPRKSRCCAEGQKVVEEDFAKIINCLEEVAKATAVFALKAVVFGTCQCGNVLYVGQREFDNEDLVLCSNRRCNLLWSKWTESDGTQLLVKVETIIFECADCQAVIPVPPAQIWQPIRCSDCSSRFGVEVRLSRVDGETEGLRPYEGRRSSNFGIVPILRKRPLNGKKLTDDFEERGDKIGYHQLLPFIGFSYSDGISRCFRDWRNSQ